MNCDEVREKLLDVVEGRAAGEERAAVDVHLGGCPQCRAEFEELAEGLHGLLAAMPVVAPRERYLTHARLECIMGREAPRLFQLATYRQFVAAAAAVAIVISGAFIVAHVLGIRDARRLQEAPPVALRTEPLVHYVPVMVAAPGQGQPINVAQVMPAAAVSVRKPVS